MSVLKPDYYKGRDGKDLFQRFEEGLMTPEKTIGCYQGTIFKYITRHDRKNGIEDLKKARTYLDEWISFEEKLQQEPVSPDNVRPDGNKM